ncbi:MAG: methionine--tRNA ligase [Conexivisphaerales archaeon]
MTRWIVCSAWPYLDGSPHLGTFMHLLSADVYARYLRLKHEDVVSVSGSDEHGTPMEVEAIRTKTTPRELANRYHAEMLEILKTFMVELDNYTRTESPVHVKFVQDFYLRLYQRGYIYSQKVVQLYCNNDERFLPDRFVEGICPYCKYESARGDQCDNCGRLLDPLELEKPRCVICGQTPQPKETEHWFFDLSKLSAELNKYIDQNKELPENARNFSKNWLKEGLRPRALTRDSKWGIPAPFPGAEGKTIYVWMEAVLGYVSAVKEWAERKGNPELFSEFWLGKDTKSVYFIGKDNIPFHTIIFPALLIASGEGYVLPTQVSSTEFILFEGKKFSKSRHIGVWMNEAMRIAKPEYWRFALMYFRPELRDSNFSWTEFDRAVNSELNDVLGNFEHRVLTFIKKFFDMSIPEAKELDEDSKQMMEELSRLWNEYVNKMDSFQIKEAVRTMLDLARKGNEYMSRREPWEQIKHDNSLAAMTLYTCAQLVYTLTIMLYPFCPLSSTKLWEMLGLEGDPVSHGIEGAGREYLKPGHRIMPPSTIFSKVVLQVE